MYKKKQVISTIYKYHLQVYEYHFCWNCLEFSDSDKIDLTTRMWIFSNVKHCHQISLGLEVKNLFYGKRKSTLILSEVFGICYRRHNLTYFNNKVCLIKKRCL